MSGPLIRLVFRPMLVENTNDPSASVKGCLREGLAVAMLREPVASIDLYLVSQGGKQPTPSVMSSRMHSRKRRHGWQAEVWRRLLHRNALRRCAKASL
jgi:hypothetical protein